MILKIDLQYFPTIISSVALFKSTYVEFCLSDPWERKGFRNRTILMSANGPVMLTVPVLGGRNQKGLYRDIRIDHRLAWQKQHWGTIFSGYGKSPWFFQYGPELEKLFQERDRFLADWNLRCLDWIWRKWVGPLPSGPGLSGEKVLNLSGSQLPASFQLGIGSALKPYPQVFQDRFGFQPNLGLLDLLFCLGPAGGNYLSAMSGENLVFNR